MIKSLESLCLDEVVQLIPVLGQHIGALPVTLLQNLLPRCDDHRLAVIGNIAESKGLDVAQYWRKLCQQQFSWSYHHKHRSNHHEPYWLCSSCRIRTVNKDSTDWRQTYLDRMCQRKLHPRHTKNCKICCKQDLADVLKFPLCPPDGDLNSESDVLQYHPECLRLDIKTWASLDKSPPALKRLCHNLKTMYCYTRKTSGYSPAVEAVVSTLLSEGRLETFCLRECGSPPGGPHYDYSNLIAILLSNSCLESNVDPRSNADSENERVLPDTQCEAEVHTPETPDDGALHEDEEGNDLYDLCFQEPVKENMSPSHGSGSTDGHHGVLDRESDHSGECYPGLLVDLFCEEGAVYSGSAQMSSLNDDFEQDEAINECAHCMKSEFNPYRHPTLHHVKCQSSTRSISSLILIHVTLRSDCSSVLANCLAFCSTLKSLSIKHCYMPSCGWCEIFSGLAQGANGDVLLDELAVVLHSHETYTFNRFCSGKLAEILEKYHRKGHLMKSLNLDFPCNIRSSCATQKSYLAKYLPNIERLLLHLPVSSNTQLHHALHQVVCQDLAVAVRQGGSVLVDLVIERCSMSSDEVDSILGAAADIPHLERISVQGNSYSTARPKGLVRILQHQKLLALNISRCSFSLKACKQQFKDDLVAALNSNCSLQNFNLSDEKLCDEDLSVLVKGFTKTKRTIQQSGYCLGIYLFPFSPEALQEFGSALRSGGSSCHRNQRSHSLDHLTLDWRCSSTDVPDMLRTVIPKVSLGDG